MRKKNSKKTKIYLQKPHNEKTQLQKKLFVSLFVFRLFDYKYFHIFTPFLTSSFI